MILVAIGGLSSVQPLFTYADEPREVLVVADDELPLPEPPPLLDPLTAEPMFIEPREPGRSGSKSRSTILPVRPSQTFASHLPDSAPAMALAGNGLMASGQRIT